MATTRKRLIEEAVHDCAVCGTNIVGVPAFCSECYKRAMDGGDKALTFQRDSAQALCRDMEKRVHLLEKNRDELDRLRELARASEVTGRVFVEFLEGSDPMTCRWAETILGSYLNGVFKGRQRTVSFDAAPWIKEAQLREANLQARLHEMTALRDAAKEDAKESLERLAGVERERDRMSGSYMQAVRDRDDAIKHAAERVGEVVKDPDGSSLMFVSGAKVWHKTTGAGPWSLVQPATLLATQELPHHTAAQGRVTDLTVEKAWTVEVKPGKFKVMPESVLMLKEPEKRPSFFGPAFVLRLLAAAVLAAVLKKLFTG